MLTPQDIQNKEFAKAVFGGYDMTAVDDFLEDISEDYADLYKENAVLKSKIKVLVEKVEEYRSTEDAMRMALVTAQKMGDDLLVEAKEKSASMLSDAETEAARRLHEMEEAVALEENKLSLAQAKTMQFIQAAEAAIKTYTKFLEKLPNCEVKNAPKVAPKATPVQVNRVSVTATPAASAEKVSVAEETKASVKSENEIVDTAKEIDAYVSKMLGADDSSSEEDETKIFRVKDADSRWSDEDEPTSPRPKFDFNDLKFGVNYDKE